ncbi:MAG TPA: 30S ribosomal protein S3, partial [Patescibacteria group bacterium]
MGQKVNPKSFRMGGKGLFTWDSKWFSKKNFPGLLKQDVKIRKFIMKKLKTALVSKVEIERSRGNLAINIYAVKPGLIIGRAGAGIDELRSDIQTKILKDKKILLNINIKEVKKPSLTAQVVLQNMIFDLEKRLPFRRVLKQTIARVEKEGAEGVKVSVSGRLNGAEIARSETLTSGKIPLHTLRANIDYAR